MRTLITGGTVVTASDTYQADVLIEDEKIPASASGFTADTHHRRARQVRHPRRHRRAYAPRHALRRHRRLRRLLHRAPRGGVRRHDHAHRLRHPAQGRDACARRWTCGTAKANGKAAIDYGFHLAITDLPDSVMDEIKQCAGVGRHQPQALHGLQGLADGGRRDALPRDGAGGASTACSSWSMPRTATRLTSSCSQALARRATPTRSTTR